MSEQFLKLIRKNIFKPQSQRILRFHYLKKFKNSEYFYPISKFEKLINMVKKSKVIRPQF